VDWWIVFYINCNPAGWLLWMALVVMWNVDRAVQSVVEVTSSASGKRSVCGATSSSRGAGGKTGVRRIRDVREPSLSVSFPNKIGSYELKIVRQPEDQHRARYLTEGSRGTVKDKTQQSHPTVKVYFSTVHSACHCAVFSVWKLLVFYYYYDYIFAHQTAKSV